MTFESGSTLTINIPLVPISDIFNTTIFMDMKNTVCSSSVNFEVFFELDRLVLETDIQSPLQWNGARRNEIKVKTSHSNLFALKRHVNLINDLISDFSITSAVSVAYFIPSMYEMSIECSDSETLFCVNKNNVIEVHNDLEENCIGI